MYREKLEELKAWQQSKYRKPLILNGARQVGKTWLLEEFGRLCYERTAYINLADSARARSIFDEDFDIERIVDGLELYSDTKIEPNNTLIILDEIQECPRALESLKYFCENAPDYHVAVAGSLLGVALHGGQASFPVGKVSHLHLYPMNFLEFLRATGKARFAEAIAARDPERLRPFHTALLDALKTYYAVGGMPAVVQNYISEGNVLMTRQIQSDILSDYERDFSKHAPASALPKIREIFRIIPREQAKENKKFLFSMIKSGARAAEYDSALLWLEDAGLVTRVNRVEAVKLPFTAYYEKDAFKLYLLDVGLLGALARLDPKILLDGDSLFVEFRGAFTEQFVLQELKSAGYYPWYYKKDKPAREVDFLIEKDGGFIPIEVKSGEKTYSKSLGEFIREYGVENAVKLSQAVYRPREKGAVEYLPLYFAGNPAS
ncbi:ATP-binding protein [Candidatus Saccharibacteria bacterium]|nr:ATP-binding protein [Candidatus Saccharibacteria bacterium]